MDAVFISINWLIFADPQYNKCLLIVAKQIFYNFELPS